VVIQNSSACSSARWVWSHPVAAAAGSLNRESRVVIGVVTALPFPVVRRWRAAGGPAVLLLAQTDLGRVIHRPGGEHRAGVRSGHVDTYIRTLRANGRC